MEGIYFEGTPMQIWNSPYMFGYILKKYSDLNISDS